jgi:hypothetical protein
MNMNMKNVKLILLVVATIFITSLAFTTPIFADTNTKLSSFLIANWPDIFKTREQNLDTNGNIKIHEQGSIEVHGPNGSPLPVQLSGVGLSTKIITVFDNINAQSTTTSGIIDVDGYKKIGIFLNTDSYSFANVNLRFNIDGITEFTGGNPMADVTLSGPVHAKYTLVDVAGPKVKLYFNGGVDPANATVRLYLIP